MEKQQEPTVVHVTQRENENIKMESMCPGCFKTGETRMLLTDIPFFRSVIVTSFDCPHCFLRNHEVQSGGSLNEFGHDIKLTVTCKEDLQRDIVRDGWATTYIPELQLQIPCTQKGHMTTIEGLLKSFKEDLEMGQEARRKTKPDYADQLDEFIRKLEKYVTAEDDILPFTLRFCDPTGNSFIQNLKAPLPDEHLVIEKFSRTKEQLIAMGYSPENTAANLEVVKEEDKEENMKKLDEETKAKFENLKKQFEGLQYNNMGGKKTKYTKEHTDEMITKMQKINKEKVGLSAHKMDFTQSLDEKKVQEDVIHFSVQCHNCSNMGEVRMCTCKIPYFTEIIIMAFTCDACGARSTEVKAGGGISEKATKYTLTISTVEDMNRDLFKSDTAEIEIPEIGIKVMSGSLGGVFSTVEGLIKKMLDTLRDDNPFIGDSSAKMGEKSPFALFLVKLQKVKDGKLLPFTMIIDDPMSNCFVQNPNHPNPDPIVEIEVYERTFEQNEDLGINDMVV